MAHSNGIDEGNRNPYSSLLNALRSSKDITPARKKRRLIDSERDATFTSTQDETISTIKERVPIVASDDSTVDLSEPTNDMENPSGGDDDDEHGDSDGNGETFLRDPFEKHYFNGSHLESFIMKEGPISKKAVITEMNDGLRKTWFPGHEGPEPPLPVNKSQDPHLKTRLASQGAELLSRLSTSQKDIAGALFSYVDVIAGCRTVGDSPLFRELCCLHSLNHVFKTRDRILKSNTKLSQAENPEALDLRDQGFTRPKVLIVVPTKQACVRFVESIVKFSQPEQQENKSRFLDTFSREAEDEWREKPDDFRELFGGNHEEDFRIGLKFTRKTIKYFSGFYKSDIIICSPLGLMRTITTGGGGKEDKKSHDADFLSSIDIAVVDHASALQMQNWQHVDYVFSQFNQLPKESHGCDFSRVRNTYLDGHAKYLRQTIIMSAYLTPEINSLVSKHLHNLAGRAKYVPSYKGTMLEVSNALPMPVVQTFLRFQSPSPPNDSDARFKYYTTTILPQLVRDKNNQQGVLLFVPSYADFVRLRNHLSNSSDGTSISFGDISEYTPVKEVSRARSHFMSGRYSLLLYSERAHHHFRYRLRGVRKIVFYGVPENPVFWAEIVSLLAMDVGLQQSHDTKGKGLVRALFSRWDIMKLERVVGTERVGKLLSERIGDTFDFI